jgi:hypothetical protein
LEAVAGVDVSQITPRLFISSWPRPGESVRLRQLGIRLVISMTTRQPPPEFCAEPLEWVHVPAIDSPFTPIPLDGLRRGVLAAIPILAAGDGVLCHCREGRHRSVAMACCILIAQGCGAAGAIALVEDRRRAADPGAFWVRPRIERFERAWLGGWREDATVPAEAMESRCGGSNV